MEVVPTRRRTWGASSGSSDCGAATVVAVESSVWELKRLPAGLKAPGMGSREVGRRYLYICEDGLVHYCSQQRGFPGVPIAEYTTADVKREFLTAKSCSPNCTISCVHQVSYIDHWRSPQTRTISPGGAGHGEPELVTIGGAK